MIVNLDEFHAIILNKIESNMSCTPNIDENAIELTNTVKLLAVNIDHKLRFDFHISKLCSKAAVQLNNLSRLKKYMGKEEKKAVINSFIIANFNYCPLVWHFRSCASARKIDQISKSYLRMVLNDHKSEYETLLKKSNNSTMEVKRLRILAHEIFKAINNINPHYMRYLFTTKNARVRPNDILVKSH